MMTPAFVCTECAEKAGGKMHPEHAATWHNGECGICHKTKAVTEPRDFGHPVFKDE
jgi:hypothetical protein